MKVDNEQNPRDAYKQTHQRCPPTSAALHANREREQNARYRPHDFAPSRPGTRIRRAANFRFIVNNEKTMDQNQTVTKAGIARAPTYPASGVSAAPTNRLTHRRCEIIRRILVEKNTGRGFLQNPSIA